MTNSVPPDVHEAFRQVCQEFGVKKLSALMNISLGVLNNKCNVDNCHHKPTGADFVLVTLLTGDKRIAQAFSRTVGGVHIDLPDLSNFSTDALLSHLLTLEKESGHFYQKLSDAQECDGISSREYKLIEQEAYHWVAAILECLVRIKEMSRG